MFAFAHWQDSPLQVPKTPCLSLCPTEKTGVLFCVPYIFLPLEQPPDLWPQPDVRSLARDEPQILRGPLGVLLSPKSTELGTVHHWTICSTKQRADRSLGFSLLLTPPKLLRS